MKNEIIIYQNEDTSTKIEVRLEEETVWLTQAQMSELFQTTRNNITLHISNIFSEKELEENSVCKESLLTAKMVKNTEPNSTISISSFLLVIALNPNRGHNSVSGQTKC